MRLKLMVGMAVLMMTLPVAAQPVTPENAAGARDLFEFPSDSDIRDLLQSYIDAGMVEGIVVGMRRPDGTRQYVAAGRSGTSHPLGARSVFEIGSINKTFTGAVLADMVRRGEVAFDDPVQTYLPADVRMPKRGDRPVTLLDLATHRSGLPRDDESYVAPDPSNPAKSYAASDLYAFLNAHELEREPGGTPRYSNIGFGLLGHVLARAAGRPDFQTLVRERILDPLGMDDTHYGRPPAIASRMVRGHSATGPTGYWDVDVLAGLGGLNSNAIDMTDYLDAHLGPPTRPIDHALRDAQRSHAVMEGAPDGTAIGLAWGRRTRGDATLVVHNGGTAGFAAFVGVEPNRGAGVVVLTNRGKFDYADYIGRRLLVGDWSAPLPLSKDDRAAALGRYRLANGAILAIEERGERLYAALGDDPAFPIFAAAPDRLVMRAMDQELALKRTDAGKVVAIELKRGGRTVAGERVQ